MNTTGGLLQVAAAAFPLLPSAGSERQPGPRRQAGAGNRAELHHRHVECRRAHREIGGEVGRPVGPAGAVVVAVRLTGPPGAAISTWYASLSSPSGMSPASQPSASSRPRRTQLSRAPPSLGRHQSEMHRRQRLAARRPPATRFHEAAVGDVAAGRPDPPGQRQPELPGAQSRRLRPSSSMTSAHPRGARRHGIAGAELAAQQPRKPPELRLDFLGLGELYDLPHAVCRPHGAGVRAVEQLQPADARRLRSVKRDDQQARCRSNRPSTCPAAAARPVRQGLPAATIAARWEKPVSSGEASSTWLFHGFCHTATRKWSCAASPLTRARQVEEEHMRQAGGDRGCGRGSRGTFAQRDAAARSTRRALMRRTSPSSTSVTRYSDVPTSGSVTTAPGSNPSR